MGIAAGTAAAQAMIESRQGDGRFGPSQFVPNANDHTCVGDRGLVLETAAILDPNEPER